MNTSILFENNFWSATSMENENNNDLLDVISEFFTIPQTEPTSSSNQLNMQMQNYAPPLPMQIDTDILCDYKLEDLNNVASSFQSENTQFFINQDTINYPLNDTAIYELSTLIQQLKLVSNTVTNTNDMNIINSFTQTFDNVYNRLISVDEKLQFIYDGFVNKHLENNFDIINTEKFDFLELKKYLNDVIKCAVNLFVLCSEQDPRFGKLRGLLDRLLAKGFMIMQQPPQVIIQTKTFSAKLGLICPNEFLSGSDSVVSVKLLSGEIKKTCFAPKDDKSKFMSILC